MKVEYVEQQFVIKVFNVKSLYFILRLFFIANGKLAAIENKYVLIAETLYV